MLQLLRKVETISACRDREILGVSLVAAIHEVFRFPLVELVRCIGAAGNVMVATTCRATDAGLVPVRPEAGQRGATGENGASPIENQPLMLQAWWENGAVSVADSAGVTVVYPLGKGTGAMPFGFLRIQTEQLPDEIKREAMERFLRFYSNHLGLLDYSEFDTLTGLLNRKTFDEAFDQIIQEAYEAQHPRTPPGGVERRAGKPEGLPHWLGVVDIDRFKSVNDTFGHLFGDEVLLRLANLMRKTFRAHDRLFRFGGEEFVVMLRSSTREHAIEAFERLRCNAAGHEFPQIGQVTCSIGFTQVDPRLPPPEILGRADTALYFSKENGRDKVSCYEELVDLGLIVPRTAPVSQSEADIDTLFN